MYQHCLRRSSIYRVSSVVKMYKNGPAKDNKVVIYCRAKVCETMQRLNNIAANGGARYGKRPGQVGVRGSADEVGAGQATLMASGGAAQAVAGVLVVPLRGRIGGLVV